MKIIIRSIVENVLSETKAGFKSILNFEHAIERKKMDHQKSKSTLSAILLSLTLGVAVFLAGPAAAQKKYVTDPSTGKVVTAPEYGGTITFGTSSEPPNCDPGQGHPGFQCWFFTNEKLAFADWAIDRQRFGFDSQWVPDFAITGQLAESWEQTDPVTYTVRIRGGVHWHDKAPMNGRELSAKDVEYNWHRYLGLGGG